jgi:hypothetical protein
MNESMKDTDGYELVVGDIVRIIGVPDLSGMAPGCLEESLSLFEYLVGKYKKIIGFNTTGGVPPHAEFDFRMKVGDSWESHWVCIEPELLRKKQSQKSNLTLDRTS